MFYIHADRGIVGDGKTVMSPIWIGIEGKWIVEVSSQKPEAATTENTTVLGNVTLTPGLINAHEHIFRKPIPFSENLTHTEAAKLYYSSNSYTDILCKAIAFAGYTLREEGVTFVRDLGWSGTEHPFALQKALNSDLLEGPDIQVCGTYVCSTGGHGWSLGQCYEADGPDEVKKGVRTQLKHGATVIKLMGSGGTGLYPDELPEHPEYSYEEMKAAVDVAHDAGVKVAIHCYSKEGILRALRAGVDTIEHGCLIDDECIELMCKTGAAFVPTMIGIRTPITRSKNMLKYLDELNELLFYPQIEAMRKCRAAGILVGCGSDTRGTVHEEIRMMAEALRLTPVEIMEHATSISAQILGRPDFGLLAPGKLAHIAAFEGDLTKSLDCLDHVVQVWKNGKARKFAVGYHNEF